jgi:hypothetical protein
MGQSFSGDGMAVEAKAYVYGYGYYWWYYAIPTSNRHAPGKEN